MQSQRKWSGLQQKRKKVPKQHSKIDMWEMKFRPIQPSCRQSMLRKPQVSSLVHCRFGHINTQYIQKTMTSGAVRGLKQETMDNFDCTICPLGKQTRDTFPAVEDRDKRKPSLKIMFDLAGYTDRLSASLGGNRYFLLLKDEGSDFRKVYFLKNKDESANCIIDFIEFLEKATREAVMFHISDNAREFLCRQLQNYLKKKYIIHETSSPYTPQMNGQIERVMRTVKQLATCMKQVYGTPEELWAEAIATAVFLLNRTLDKNNQTMTAYEQIFKRKPWLGHLDIFGCQAYALLPEYKQKAWQAKN